MFSKGGQDIYIRIHILLIMFYTYSREGINLIEKEIFTKMAE